MPKSLPLVFVWVLVVASVSAGPLSGRAAESAASDDWGPIEILSISVAPGTKQKTGFVPYESFEGGYLNTGLRVARGARPGPTLCVVGGVHGDELNGAEIARRVSAATDPEALSGTLLVVPAANLHGVRTGNRYMPDRRDLNRSFPGSREGSVASLVAHALFTRVIERCDFLIDLHTGSNFRTNLPQIRVDLANPVALDMARHFGVGIVLGGEGPRKSLRREAMEVGIPAVIYEAGEPNRFQLEKIEQGVEGVTNVMRFLGMLEEKREKPPLTRVYEKSSWVRVPVGKGGVYFPDVALGTRVKEGDLLGNVTSPDDDVTYEIRAPYPGEVIGMAVPSIVLSGYAVFHIGRDGDE
jgi:predicted deacylase